MAIAKIQMPDGRIARFEVPDGMTEQEVIQSIDVNNLPSAEPIKEKPMQSSSMMGAIGRGTEQAFTLGFGDELKAMMGAGIAKGAGVEDSFSDLYKESLSSQNKRLSKDFEDRPISTIAGSMAGGIGGLKTAVKFAPKVMDKVLRANTFLGARAKDALFGGLMGGITGVGTAEEDRFGGGLLGAGAGAVLTPVLGGAGVGIANVGSKIANKYFKKSSEEVAEAYMTTNADLFKPIRVSSADLGDNEARSIFDIARSGRLGDAAKDLADGFDEKQSRDFIDNFVYLYEDGKISNQALGEQLGKRLKDASNKARLDKEQAYRVAIPALKEARIEKGNLIPLSANIKNALKDYDPAIVPEVKSIFDSINQLDELLANKGVKAIKLNTIEALRKRFSALHSNSLDKKGGAGNAVSKIARGEIDNLADDLFEKGLVEGSPGVLKSINEARKLNAYWKENFSGKNANNIIRKYITSKGENLTSDMLLEKFININEAGLNGIKSAKEIFGNNIQPIFKQGILNKIYDKGVVLKPKVDAGGKAVFDGSGNPVYDEFINPEGLARNINKFLTKDREFLKEAGFSNDDMKYMARLEQVARQVSAPFDKTNPSGSANKMLDLMKQNSTFAALFKFPIIKDVMEEKRNIQGVNQISDIIKGQQRGAKTLLGVVSGLPNPAITPDKQRMIDALKQTTKSDNPIGGFVDYGMQHRPPRPSDGAPAHNLMGKDGDFYPPDVYSENALRYYGQGDRIADKESLDILKRIKDKPDADVFIYRAVPENATNKNINSGDWVTLSETYAKQHGQSNLDNNYKLIKKKVKAKELYTNADSLNEFGYWGGGE